MADAVDLKSLDCTARQHPGGRNQPDAVGSGAISPSR